jgi:IS4 transposase
MKSNAVYEVDNGMFEQTLQPKEAGVFKEEHVHLKYQEDKTEKTLCLRNVPYQDDKGRIYLFICNNFEITNQEIAFLYTKRWNIELLFKKLKQNFQLHYFYSETENCIKTQIWCTLIAHRLLKILSVKANTKKAFSTICAIIRIHLISLLELFWLIETTQDLHEKETK